MCVEISVGVSLSIHATNRPRVKFSLPLSIRHEYNYDDVPSLGRAGAGVLGRGVSRELSFTACMWFCTCQSFTRAAVPRLPVLRRAERLGLIILISCCESRLFAQPVDVKLADHNLRRQGPLQTSEHARVGDGHVRGLLQEPARLVGWMMRLESLHMRVSVVRGWLS